MDHGHERKPLGLGLWILLLRWRRYPFGCAYRWFGCDAAGTKKKRTWLASATSTCHRKAMSKPRFNVNIFGNYTGAPLVPSLEIRCFELFMSEFDVWRHGQHVLNLHLGVLWHQWWAWSPAFSHRIPTSVPWRGSWRFHRSTVEPPPWAANEAWICSDASGTPSAWCRRHYWGWAHASWLGIGYLSIK